MEDPEVRNARLEAQLEEALHTMEKEKILSFLVELRKWMKEQYYNHTPSRDHSTKIATGSVSPTDDNNIYH